MRKISLWIVFLFFSGSLTAQTLLEDSVIIPEVNIQSKKAEPGTQQLNADVLNKPVYSDLGEALQKESHLFIKTYGSGSLATPSMRGSGSAHTQLYWNGILLNAPSNGTYDLALIPNLFVDQLEIKYGLQSISHGGGGLGGAILMENQPQFSNNEKLKLSQSVGSFGRRTTAMKWQMGNEKWQSVSRIFRREAKNDFKYKDMTTEGFPTKRVENADLSQSGAMQSFHYRLGSNQLLQAHLWWSFSDRTLPALITLSDNRERQEDESFKAVAKYNYYGKNWLFNYRFAATSDRLIYENPKANISDSSKVKGIFNQLNLERAWGERLQTKTQLQFNYQQAQSPQLLNHPERKTLSLFQQITYTPHKKVELQANLRSDYIFEQKHLFMPVLSIHYLPGKTKYWTVYMKAGQNQKFPSLNDLYVRPFGNPDLKSEKSKTIEMGGSWAKATQKFNFSTQLNFYSSQIQNYIQWQPTAFGFWQAVNLQDVLSRGIEWQLRLNQTEGKLKKSFFLNYTYTQSINQKKSHAFDESKGKQLIYIPENQINAGVGLSFKKFDLSYQYHFVGHRYTSSDQSRFLQAYSTSDLTLARKLSYKKHQFDLSFSIMNLFDTNYQMMEWRPVPGRNFRLKLSYTLDRK